MSRNRIPRRTRPRFRDAEHERVWVLGSWPSEPMEGRLPGFIPEPFTLKLGPLARMDEYFEGVLACPPQGAFPPKARARLACCERVVTKVDNAGRARTRDWVLWEADVALDPVPALTGGLAAPVRISLAGAAHARPTSLRFRERPYSEIGARGVTW